MTPTQYYFPYFFQLDDFNKEVKPFGLAAFVTNDSKTEMPDKLLVTKKGSHDVLLSIPFGATLMVQGNKLFYWKTDYDLLDITQVQLDDTTTTQKQLNERIDLLKFKIGHNELATALDIRNFVTFVRKEDLTYQQDYYERFVIVVINNNNISIIPFDWLNKTGGDYGYVWPATARMDKNRIYGQGMRMANFMVELDQASL
ncbi:hypothetical protein [Flavisolibacter nicotianae]|uniref:hypothetical protein n=1 Tax=Flavisolibacter nicotianae TaxID=2364882 RepID=UPI000EB33C74|nr:hypothetical protein [Flavisolibacter nicotianae]